LCWRAPQQSKPNLKLRLPSRQSFEFIFNIAKETSAKKAKRRKHLPLLVNLFSFILVANLSGLIPGVGTLTVDNGEPLFRAFTTDLNGTLALAILTIGTVQFYAIKELGIIGHLKHYFSDKPWNPMNLFIGLIEVMGEFIRILTSSMRLFGVIYAGEVLDPCCRPAWRRVGWATQLPIYLMDIFLLRRLFVMIVAILGYRGCIKTVGLDNAKKNLHQVDWQLRCPAKTRRQAGDNMDQHFAGVITPNKRMLRVKSG